MTVAVGFCTVRDRIDVFRPDATVFERFERCLQRGTVEAVVIDLDPDDACTQRFNRVMAPP